MGSSTFSIDAKNVLNIAGKKKLAGFSTCAPATKCAHLPKRKIKKNEGVCLVVTTKSLSHDDDKFVATIIEFDKLPDAKTKERKSEEKHKWGQQRSARGCRSYNRSLLR